MKNAVTAAEVQDMVLHWLNTPPNGYLGSGYGSEPQALLQEPISAALGMGDNFVDKLMRDLPLLRALPPGSVDVYLVERDNESTSLVIDIAGTKVSVDNIDKSKLTR